MELTNPAYRTLFNAITVAIERPGVPASVVEHLKAAQIAAEDLIINAECEMKRI